MLHTLTVLLQVLSFGYVLQAMPQSRENRVLRISSGNGTLQRVVYLPKIQLQESEEDGFVLVSDSSVNKFKVPETKKRKVKRRRKKKPVTVKNQNFTAGIKDPKFLNLFTIVKFDNNDCDQGGICYHDYECKQLGGTSIGPCAKGFGVCCVFEAQCDEMTEKAVSLFVGGTAEGACTLGVQKMQCAKQLRFEFFDLDLDAPVDGTCVNDRLLVTGQNSNDGVPIICGANSGQHMNIDIDEVDGPIMLSVISPDKKKFKIKVSQLCEGNPLLAPKGCLQYFTESSGEIKSFNYKDQDPESAYLNNMNYAICFKKNRGMCSVEYSSVGPAGEDYTFDINNIDLGSSDGEQTVPEGEAGVEVFNCPEDYLAISGVRLCGQRFNDASVNADFTQNAPVVDRGNGPFMVSFVSSPSNAGKGFHLQYEQKPCL